MVSTVASAALQGMEAVMLHVEVDAAQGLPGFMMVGYLSSEVKEAGERVRVALKNSGISIPPMRITVNLSPADVRKAGTAFDLPIAVGLLKALKKLPEECSDKTVVAGELSLDGAVNPVKGILPLVKKAKEAGYEKCIVPLWNKEEGELVPDIEVIGVESLEETIKVLEGEKKQQKKTSIKNPITYPFECGKETAGNAENTEIAEPDFADVNGQAQARRAVEIAAAGFHHMLLIGPPGSGKTMIASRVSGVLPPLTLEESLEVTAVHSVAGCLDSGNVLIRERPFLSPHHTVTEPALAGGGRIPRPGIVSLAHKGILFLDEMPEFRQRILDMLRQPLEEKKIHIARMGGNYDFPADFMLIGAMNPCPCGYYPDYNKCKCTLAAVKKYQNRVSGPILDRIDICAEVSRTGLKELTENGKNESSSSMRERVLKARRMQEERFKDTSYRFNSEIEARDIEKYCKLGKAEKKLMKQAFTTMDLSARGYHKILRVARTIADLDESAEIREIHLAEAIGCRMNSEKYQI